MPVTTTEPAAVVTLTDQARQVVRQALAAQSPAEELALYVEVKGALDGAFVYDLYFQPVAQAGDGAATFYDDDVAVVVPTSSIDPLRGARLEWSTEGQGGLVMVNPNKPGASHGAEGVPAEVAAAGLSGPLATRARVVIAEEINPAIAAHGGAAELCAMDEEAAVAYLRLSGGCQGCAMSRLTLTEGIETALRDQIPELTAVIDVTDHQSGEDPFF
jgi:Fe/S biogenesis protein NfuA